MAFQTEEELVRKALESEYIMDLIDINPEGTSYWGLEVPGLFGIPDLVIFYVDPSAKRSRKFVTIAFEMKLSKWQQAIAQAYCYKSFANKSYVLIDQAHINPPKDNLARFERANIGLLSINDEGEIIPYCEPRYQKPYSKSIEETFLDIVFKQEYSRQLLSLHKGQFRRNSSPLNLSPI